MRTSVLSLLAACLVGGAHGFAVGASPRAVARVTPAPAMSSSGLGYQTESAGSSALVREMALADNIMMLRVAAARAATEKDLVSQRSLLTACNHLKTTISEQLESIRMQEQQLTRLLRATDDVTRMGQGMMTSECARPREPLAWRARTHATAGDAIPTPKAASAALSPRPSQPAPASLHFSRPPPSPRHHTPQV